MDPLLTIGAGDFGARHRMAPCSELETAWTVARKAQRLVHQANRATALTAFAARTRRQELAVNTTLKLAVLYVRLRPQVPLASQARAFPFGPKLCRHADDSPRPAPDSCVVG
jgi:hypothetical protein